MAIDEASARLAKVRDAKEEALAKKLFAARAAAFIADKHYDEALLDLNQAIEIDSMPGFKIYSAHADWYFERAFIWQQKGDDAHALADLNVAAKLDPRVIEKVKGTKFEKVLSPKAADSSVLIESGDTALLHKLMGNEWAAAGSPANATSEFDKAIALDPNYAEAYNNRGLAWMQLKNFQSAERDMNKAIELKADDPRFFINRSTLHLYQQRPAEAVADAKKATELEALNADFWEALATAQQFNNEYAAAEESLNTELAFVDRDQEAGVRAKIALVRALQNKTPTQQEQDALFTVLGTKERKFLMQALDSELTRHPEIAALKDLRAAVVASEERVKKQPLFIP